MLKRNPYWMLSYLKGVSLNRKIYGDTRVRLDPDHCIVVL